MIENARVIFRNFSGEESKFNRAGQRNFCVIIENEDEARRLEADGWNIKQLKPRDPDDAPAFYIQVAVSFDNVPPNVYMYTRTTKTQLNEETISALDYAEIQNIDLILSPYFWEVNGKSGIKAYLKTAHVTIVEDEFASKYERYE
jgi:hypothetical protein